MSTALLLKLLLAPGLIGVATLSARRHGPSAAGWWASTPVIVAPVLLAFTLGHGNRFGVDGARNATLGLVSLSAFTATYALAARRRWRWPPCLLCGYGAFACSTLALSLLAVPTLAALAAAIGVSLLARRSVRAAGLGPTRFGARLPFDLPLRMAAGLAMVLVLSALAGRLGAHASGLLAPFPVIGSVMAVFTHRTGGHRAVAPYADALLQGMPSFALSVAVIALTLRPLGTAPAFALCALVAAGAHTVLIANARRPAGGWRRGTPPPGQ